MALAVWLVPEGWGRQTTGSSYGPSRLCAALWRGCATPDPTAVSAPYTLQGLPPRPLPCSHATEDLQSVTTTLPSRLRAAEDPSLS
eukprot:CAMPEP_0181181862 /NCGR_PEP_ID=MMETSP1096-20121128/7566_1 /TAXON_ID=156174 ORGANISM="Chrysochromulina ericina, Strain CCMP281" /NCGR_SAMPLE_ID=MMETSP1096 /ASSEMBLY_ACC=CAM_ASM_000453 /LENGTH=85 /DNA_ID=CAMNT_0023270399 /DNA_START=234 /DNA_END=491 /DNA_ORIENTATION=-